MRNTIKTGDKKALTWHFAMREKEQVWFLSCNKGKTKGTSMLTMQQLL